MIEIKKEKKIELGTYLAIFFLLLSACSTVIDKVSIRDVVDINTSTQIRKAKKIKPDNKLVVVEKRFPVRATIVSPSKKIALSITVLKERLLQQSRNKLANNNEKAAIVLAERGLRIDRKEARFYYILALAYASLGNNKQSVYFAEQGLRYSHESDIVYALLKALSDK